MRNQKNIGPKEPLTLVAVGANAYGANDCVVAKMANLSKIDIASETPADAQKFMVGTAEYAVPVGSLIDVAAEIAKQEAQLKHLEGFKAGIEKKLANEKFVSHAPEAVVALERKKLSDSEEKIAALRASLAELKKQ